MCMFNVKSVAFKKSKLKLTLNRTNKTPGLVTGHKTQQKLVRNERMRVGCISFIITYL